MRTTLGSRLRAALAPAAALGLALVAASPAIAATGTPLAPTALFNGLQACSTDATAPVYLQTGWGSSAGIPIEGVPQGTDAVGNPALTVQYQVWPAASPTQITTLSSTTYSSGVEASATVPSAGLTEGQTYAWRAQTVAGGTTSDWSTPCYFTLDNTAPAKAPTVSSSNYPQGQWDQGGAPVQFTFGANGVDDVAGFEFSWFDNSLPAPSIGIGPGGVPQPFDPYTQFPRTFARATTVGGTATVSLLPPTGSGAMTLWVASLDRAFNRGPETSYTFYVKSTAPTAAPLPPSPQFDKTTPFKIKPNPGLQSASPVVSYVVSVYGGPTVQTYHVQADSDGTAVVPVTLNGAYSNEVVATSTSTDGWVSGSSWWSSGYVDTSPTVSSDVYVENASSGGVGVPGTFTFAPKVKGVVSYTYSIDWWGPATTVSAGGNGTAQITWTPDQNGWHDIYVYATTRDGLQLAPYDYSFTVN